jgi:hypothetical protein
MLKPYADVEVGCAGANIKQSLAAEKPGKRAKGAVLNNNAIKHHLTELRNAGNDRNAFDLAVKNLKDSKSLKLPELAEIARQFSLSATSYKSKAGAHSDIEKHSSARDVLKNKVS